MIQRFDAQHNWTGPPELQDNFPIEDFGPHPVTQVAIRSYLRKKPFWTSRDGEVFETVQDIEDNHLMNLIPFMSSRAHGLDMLMKTLDEDQKQSIKKNAEILREKARACIEEASRRKLLT